MKENVSKLIAQLEKVKNPTGWQSSALASLKAAERQLRYHEEAQAKASKPKARDKAPAK